MHGFRKSPVKNFLELSYTRLGVAAFLIWILSTVFFLSHAVHGLHYAMPAIFASVALIGLGSLGIEATSTRSADSTPKSRSRLVIGIALIILSAALSANHAWRERANI